MWRYIRAFFKALAMTIRGEKPVLPAEREYPRLFDWMADAREAVLAVFDAAETAGYDAAARQGTEIVVDGRETDVDTLLRAVRYHLTEEYPYMLRHLTEHSLAGVYASNMNDTHWVKMIAETPDVPDSIRSPLENLQKTLSAIPPSNDLTSSS